MTDNQSGSQSRTVVLLASVFVLMLAAGCAWQAWQGGDAESVFPLFRSTFIVRLIMIPGTILFLAIAIIGFRKLPRLPHW